MNTMKNTAGFALTLVLVMCTMVILLLVLYATLTVNNVRTSHNDGNYSSAYYAAEASLNGRLESVRAKFIGFQTPSGTSPSSSTPCVGSDLGTGDLKCITTVVNGRNVTSYVTQGAEGQITIPAGQNFAGLSATETPFTVYGTSYNSKNNPEAITSLAFRSRLVPLFQFAIFFDKDLEFDNTATMTLDGPVHTNGYMFLDSGASSTLKLTGQVTSAGQIWRGKKQTATCSSGNTIINDNSNNPVTTASCTTRYQLTGSALTTFGGRVKDNIGVLTVPTIGVLQPQVGATYWDKADIRVVLKNTGTYSAPIWTPLVVDSSGVTIPLTGTTCAAGLTTSQNLRDNREAQNWSTGDSRQSRRTLDVDVKNLLACMQYNRSALGLSGLDDTTDGGLDIYMTVDDMAGTSISSGLLRPTLGAAGQNSSQSNPPVVNNYAIRLYNGASLTSTSTSDPKPVGITFASDQSVFIEGDFNSAASASAGWIPSAVMSDSINVLSNNWRTAENCTRIDTSAFLGMRYDSRYASAITTITMPSGNYYQYSGSYFNYASTFGGIVRATPTTANPDIKSSMPMACRNATTTTINTAIFSGTATTGTADSTLYTNASLNTSGGVHNMTRFHENWGSGSGAVFNYRGSLVSLSKPLHAAGTFQLDQNIYYTPPKRAWGFEPEFRSSSKLPPLSPRFTYLRQDNMTRAFEQ